MSQGRLRYTAEVEMDEMAQRSLRCRCANVCQAQSTFAFQNLSHNIWMSAVSLTSTHCGRDVSDTSSPLLWWRAGDCVTTAGGSGLFPAAGLSVWRFDGWRMLMYVDMLSVLTRTCLFVSGTKCFNTFSTKDSSRQFMLKYRGFSYHPHTTWDSSHPCQREKH